MARVPPAFDDTEAGILTEMYGAADGTYDSYTLARILNPTVEVATDASLTAFLKTREATERLIVGGLVHPGERQSGADGVYFNKLKLTTKGVKAAIQQRKVNEDAKKAIEEAVKRSKDLER
jgi:hypothetical protein